MSNDRQGPLQPEDKCGELLETIQVRAETLMFPSAVRGQSAAQLDRSIIRSVKRYL